MLNSEVEVDSYEAVGPRIWYEISTQVVVSVVLCAAKVVIGGNFSV